jgi:hypothetical protein
MENSIRQCGVRAQARASQDPESRLRALAGTCRFQQAGTVYQLMELSGVGPEVVVEVLCESSDYRELESVRDALQAESKDKLSERRFAVRVK